MSRSPAKRHSAGRTPLRFFSPIHRASRQIARRFDRDMSHIGLSAQEAHLVSYLASYAPCTVAALVDVFGVQGSTMTSLLDRLEDRGLLARFRNPQDRRSFVIELSQNGRGSAKLIQSFIDRVEREIASRISAEDERGFQTVIAAIDQLSAQKTAAKRGRR
jgi:DNA-binding MarR family transcriptional regulator